METQIEFLQFSDRERKYYTLEFEQITFEQTKPVVERELAAQAAGLFFKQLKISEGDLAKIWDLVSERRTYLKLPNFLAAMRLCSAIKQGKPIIKLNYTTEQNVLARRSKGIPKKNPTAPGEEIKEQGRKNSETDIRNVRTLQELKDYDSVANNGNEIAKDKFKDVRIDGEKNEYPAIPLQISQEIMTPKIKDKKDDLIKENNLLSVTEKEREEEEDEEREREKNFEQNKDEILNRVEVFPVLDEVERTDTTILPQTLLNNEENRVEKSNNKIIERVAELTNKRIGKDEERKIITNFHEINSVKHDKYEFPAIPDSIEISLNPQEEKLPIPKILPVLSKQEIIRDHQLFPENSLIPVEKKKFREDLSLEIQTKFDDKSSPKPFPEEQKVPIKHFPRIPAQPKVYTPPLGQIEEEAGVINSPSHESAITVESPTLISSGWLGSTSYYLYTITTRAFGKIFTVKRRFSDMDWMHNQLLAKYKGFIIPARPEKKIIKNTDEKFIEERRLQMEKYLNIIAKHPILGISQAFMIFTQAANEKLEREKIKAEACEEYQGYSSIEDAVDKVFALLQNKFQIIFSQKIIPFNKKMSEIEEKLLKLEAPVQALSGSFTHCIHNHIEGLRMFTSLNLGEDFLTTATEYKLLYRGNSQELIRLSLEVKEEHLRLQGLKEALQSYKRTVEDCSNLETYLSRKLGKHMSSTDEDTAARYLSEIQTTQETLDRYSKSLGEIEKNISKESLDFDNEKSKHIDATIKELIVTQKEYYAKEENFWNEYLQKFN